jgi:hypothetical protein
MANRISVFPLFLLMFFTYASDGNLSLLCRLRVSEDRRFLMSEDGTPFFWLGDTAWFLFMKLSREETEKYLEDRRQKGFNVIQAMVLNDVKNTVNYYGDSALIHNEVNKALTTMGNSADDSGQYDYWDHLDYVIDLARQKDLYMALVLVWGSNIRNGSVNRQQAREYALWLSERYKNRTNIIWVNGGDIKGSDSTAIWNVIGSAIRENSPRQLITFHPFGRTQSSMWFHNESWLDFNMFQSGHKRYDQDTLGLCYGEDNWKYVMDDYKKEPIKPTLDGEPSYEGIPQGLHDTTQPYWTDSDVRRYAYWSVFAGACGFTYGHNSIMQFHKSDERTSSYGVKETWDAALNAPGASQMKFLKQLILSRSYFDRVPAPELIAGSQGEKYDYLAATKGDNYALIYTCNGSTMKIDMEKMKMKKIRAFWFNPRSGSRDYIGIFKGKGIKSFDPPGEKTTGNDWVLVLEER